MSELIEKARRMGLDRVTPQQAHESVSRFVHSHFPQHRADPEREKARITIPADLRRDDDLLLSRFIDETAELLTPRDLNEWHDDDGDVLWWFLVDGHEVTEPPTVGSPLLVEWEWAEYINDGVAGEWFFHHPKYPDARLVWTPLPQIARFEPAPAPESKEG